MQSTQDAAASSIRNVRTLPPGSVVRVFRERNRLGVATVVNRVPKARHFWNWQRLLRMLPKDPCTQSSLPHRYRLARSSGQPSDTGKAASYEFPVSYSGMLLEAVSCQYALMMAFAVTAVS